MPRALMRSMKAVRAPRSGAAGSRCERCAGSPRARSGAGRSPRVFERRERLVVSRSRCSQPAIGDPLGLLQLRAEERGDELARADRTSRSSTQVYLSTWPRKNWLRLVPFSRMISARSADRAVVDEQRAALAADDVLGLVEAERAEVADRARAAAAVGAP